MFFDFCVGPPAASDPPYGLDTIFWVLGDASYQTPHKRVSPTKTYIVFTIKGEGRIQYDGKRYRVAQGEALAMRPTREFGYGCPGDRWHFWWFELCQPQPFLAENQVLTMPTDDLSIRLFQQSLISAKSGRWDVAQSLLTSALMLLSGRAERQGVATGAETLDRAERHIRENLVDVTVVSLCDELGLQERTFRNLCHRAAGCSPKQFISRIRLETAQQMLANTSMPLDALAALLGFSDQFHFSRRFKEAFDLSPSAYRRQSGL